MPAVDPAQSQTNPGGKSGGPGSLPTYSVVLAFILVAAFLMLTYLMFNLRTAQQSEWDRGMQLYSTLEAFALSAAGALLGVTIQSGRVKAAETQAKANASTAAQAQADAQKAKSDLGGYQRAVSEMRGILGDGSVSAVSTDGGGGGPAAAGLSRVRAILATVD